MQGAMFLGDGVDQCLDRRSVVDVQAGSLAAGKLPQGFGDGRGAAFAGGRADDLDSLARQFEGDRTTDAARRAGDQSHLAFVVRFIHASSPLTSARVAGSNTVAVTSSA